MKLVILYSISDKRPRGKGAKSPADAPLSRAGSSLARDKSMYGEIYRHLTHGLESSSFVCPSPPIATRLLGVAISTTGYIDEGLESQSHNVRTSPSGAQSERQLLETKSFQAPEVGGSRRLSRVRF